MGEQLGLLKVIVVRGRKLVVRDFRSSDPYVVIKLGNQVAKTKVINSCLNPVWNEELCFSITEPSENLKLFLEVFDRDLFKADDDMGHVDLGLTPIIQAAALQRILKLSSDALLRKVKANSENHLLEDSSIRFVNKEVEQSARLRLCGVESGEIELKVKLICPSTCDPPPGTKYHTKLLEQ